MKTNYQLRRCDKPTVELQPDDEQGRPIQVSGWTITGYRDADGRYYECARRGNEERWLTLD